MLNISLFLSLIGFSQIALSGYITPEMHRDGKHLHSTAVGQIFHERSGIGVEFNTDEGDTEDNTGFQTTEYEQLRWDPYAFYHHKRFNGELAIISSSREDLPTGDINPSEVDITTYNVKLSYAVTQNFGIAFEWDNENTEGTAPLAAASSEGIESGYMLGFGFLMDSGIFLGGGYEMRKSEFTAAEGTITPTLAYDRMFGGLGYRSLDKKEGFIGEIVYRQQGDQIDNKDTETEKSIGDLDEIIFNFTYATGPVQFDFEVVSESGNDYLETYDTSGLDYYIDIEYLATRKVYLHGGYRVDTIETTFKETNTVDSYTTDVEATRFSLGIGYRTEVVDVDLTGGLTNGTTDISSNADAATSTTGTDFDLNFVYKF